MTPAADQCAAARRESILELLDRRGIGAVVLRRPENFAWYTGGGNSRVEYASPVGVADVLITPERDWVVTSAIEAPRMRAEEAQGFEVVAYPWELGPASVLRDLSGGARLGSDVALDGAAQVADDVAARRRILDPHAVDRLRGVGADLAAALQEAGDVLEPGMTEHEAAAEIAAACRRRGLVPTVLLAATAARIRDHRHPLPTVARLEGRAMLVASAQRGGLYANLTRIVHFDDPDPETARREAACREILARMRLEASRPGRTLAESFADLRRFYAEAGFPDEWRLHHQGGLTGYASREVIATPHTREMIQPGHAFAWNPSITGAKAEETFVLTGEDPEIVTVPSLEVHA